MFRLACLATAIVLNCGHSFSALIDAEFSGFGAPSQMIEIPVGFDPVLRLRSVDGSISSTDPFLSPSNRSFMEEFVGLITPFSGNVRMAPEETEISPDNYNDLPFVGNLFGSFSTILVAYEVETNVGLLLGFFQTDFPVAGDRLVLSNLMITESQGEAFFTPAITTQFSDLAPIPPNSSIMYFCNVLFILVYFASRGRLLNFSSLRRKGEI